MTKHMTGTREQWLADRLELLAAAIEKFLRKDMAKVVTVDPFHAHDADAVVRDEIVDIEKIVVLDQRRLGGDGGNASHIRVVRLVIAIRLRREHLERDRQREPIRPLAVREIHDPLPATAEEVQVPAARRPRRRARLTARR